MSGSVFYTINQSLGRIFPERRIYIRSDARTRYWTFNPVSQFGASLVAIALIGWSAFTSYAFIDNATDGRTAVNRLQASQEAYEIQLSALQDQQRLLEEELNRSNQRGDTVTRELSDKQRILVETAGRLHNSEAELAGLRGEFEALLKKRQVEQDLINDLNEEVTGLKIALADANRNEAELASTLDTFAATMHSVVAARDDAAGRAIELDNRVAVLEGEITEWESRQEHLLAQLEDASRGSLSQLDELFVGSDIDLEAILKQTRRDYTGRGGGPVEEGDDEASAIDPGQGERVAALMTDVERVSLMRVAIDRMPFGMPTRGARITSGFGPRRDPYRRSTRMHNGMDFAAPRGTPIYSTGEGVVTFSGRQSGYGIVVKIRHAFGFETVYAHLSKSRVTVGQRVERGDRIADMGSTGRSTGNHLHYEVRIDGKPVNPSKFIKAARHVL
jgi:murein DD-endopeptidase MepM/ murein hydrolase activator NlpD